MPDISQQLEKINTNLELLIELFHQGLESDKDIQDKNEVIQKEQRVRLIEN